MKVAPIHFILSVLTILLVIPLTSVSQSILGGIVTDAKTGKSIPYANVYFANTTIGTSTSEDGSFQISNIPNGKYDLIASVVGYKRFQAPIIFPSDGSVLKIQMSQEPVALSEVTIVAGKSSDSKFFSTFKKYFLGETENSNHCKIINRGDLQYYYDDVTGVLTVHSAKPIEIRNNALGYTIFYTLDYFEFNFAKGLKVQSGVARFEEFTNQNLRNSIRFEQKRRTAYLGSLNHFMHTLYTKSTSEASFSVDEIDSISLNTKANKISPDLYITGTTEKKFSFKGAFMIEYLNESEQFGYRYNRQYVPQVSYLIFQDPYITIFENGYYVRQLSVKVRGYYAWSEVIGELVPLGYGVIK